MSSQANLAKTSLSKAIESVLNTAIRLDENQGQAFKKLEDKVIAVTLAPLENPLYFMFTQYMVSVQNHLVGSADATIQTTLVDFSSLPIHRDLTHAQLSGDLELAQAFIDALCGLEIDWEEHLSHYTGDLIAFKIGHGIRSFLQTKQSAKETAGQTIREYLQFEIETLPTQSQVNRFNQAVDRISNDLEPLESRIDALLSNHSANASQP